MLNIPDPEYAAGGETEVEITDLDSGKIPGRSTRRNRVPPFQARSWMNIAVIAGTALLAVAVLVSISHLPKAARVTVPPTSIIQSLCPWSTGSAILLHPLVW